jgi:hypothetical protein
VIKVERGRVKDGGIVFSEPLGLPEGTEVAVAIEPLGESEDSRLPIDDSAFGSLPFFGMWADRDDMQDSTDWVRRERERWQQRAQRQD